MHGVQELVLDAQAEACGLPLKKVWLPDPCSDEVYRAAMAEAMDEARSSGVEAMAFGDLFLWPRSRPGAASSTTPRCDGGHVDPGGG